MALKVYKKLGRLHYSETKLVRTLEQAIADKLAKDPNALDGFVPAENKEQLQLLVDQWTSDDTPFEDIKTDTTSTASTTSKGENTSSFDPMSREEPIVRDYVQGGGELSPDNGENPDLRTTFNEPVSFHEAFAFPEENTEGNNGGGTSNGGGNGPSAPSGPRSNDGNKPKIRPLNPEFEDMNTSKKKRSTKKFAKYIVEAVVMLQEKGFVWYATKDINEAKLTEYALKGEIDLGLLVTINEGQNVTVRDFFLSQCALSEQMAKIDPEKQADLVDALAEVMLEKGVGPTPSQELMLIGLTMMGEQTIKLMTLKAQSDSVLNQLRAMANPEVKQPEAPKPEPKKPTPPPRPEPRTPPTQQPVDDGPQYVMSKPVEAAIAKEEAEMLKKQNQEPIFPEIITNGSETKE